MGKELRSHSMLAEPLPRALNDDEAVDAAVSPILPLLPPAPARIIDIGAGAGRDAALLAGMGYSVLAVEPVNSLLRAGMAKHLDPRIAWLQDKLPLLPKVAGRHEPFDAALLFGVWGHLNVDERDAALSTLSTLIVSGGVILVSLRTGRDEPHSPKGLAAVPEIVEMAARHGLRCILNTSGAALRPNDPAGVWRQLGFRTP